MGSKPGNTGGVLICVLIKVTEETTEIVSMYKWRWGIQHRGMEVLAVILAEEGC